MSCNCKKIFGDVRGYTSSFDESIYVRHSFDILVSQFENGYVSLFHLCLKNSRCSSVSIYWTMGWTTYESKFDSQQIQKFFPILPSA
jgi:hypothetical protein